MKGALVTGVVTCIVHGVPHLVAVDAAGLVGIVMFEDSLKRKKENLSFIFRATDLIRKSSQKQAAPHLPLLDLIPQMSKLLQVESAGPVHLEEAVKVKPVQPGEVRRAATSAITHRCTGSFLVMGQRSATLNTKKGIWSSFVPKPSQTYTVLNKKNIYFNFCSHTNYGIILKNQ